MHFMKFDGRYMLIALVLLSASLGAWSLMLPDSATLTSLTMKQWISFFVIVGGVVGGYFNIGLPPSRTVATALNMPPGATVADLNTVLKATDPGAVPTQTVAAAILDAPPKP